MARIMATSTSLTNSFESKTTIPVTLAPSALRMPISFVRCSAAKVANPSKPKQQITTAIKVNPRDSLPKIDSASYSLL